MAIRSGPIVVREAALRHGPKGGALLRFLQTTDHKQIGSMYLITSFGFFMAGGVMALLMRGELAVPGTQFLSPEQYNQLFTMHGTVMMLLYATPNVFGFANAILPLQIGSPDVAFPRLNALSYWLYLFDGLIVMAGFLTPNGAADFGWFAYTPLSRSQFSPNVGGNLWTIGLIVGGLSTILGAVNMMTTIICLRAPGMTHGAEIVARSGQIPVSRFATGWPPRSERDLLDLVTFDERLTTMHFKSRASAGRTTLVG